MDEDTVLPGMGVIKVTTGLLRAWMLLPDGFEIVDATMDANTSLFDKQVIFTVRHEEAPISPDGTELPTLTPIFETKLDEADGKRWHRLAKIHVNK